MRPRPVRCRLGARDARRERPRRAHRGAPRLRAARPRGLGRALAGDAGAAAGLSLGLRIHGVAAGHSDADLATAAADIALAGFFNAGQDCTAATRGVVEAGAYETLVALLAELFVAHGGMSEAHAAAQIKKMQEGGRLVQELWS